MNRLTSGILLLVVVLATACGGDKPKDAATVTTEPSSQSYPPQNPGNQNASDSLTVMPLVSTSVTPNN